MRSRAEFAQHIIPMRSAAAQLFGRCARTSACSRPASLQYLVSFSASAGPRSALHAHAVGDAESRAALGEDIMLCPEVWNFEAPQHRFEQREGRLRGPEAEKEAAEAIKAHYLNHSVSVVLPNISSIPESFDENVLEDSDYYRVDGLRTVELVNKEFIESFIKKGELTLLTVGRKIDLEDLAAITPTGQLILSLVRESYQKLGIEGKPTYFDRKDHSRYVVTIDLKDENLTPGKKYYERIRNSLDKLPELTFDAILSWDPPEEKLCPSSVAAWFHKRNYSVSVCHQQLVRRTEYTVEIPLLEDEQKREQFFEWLGIVSIGGNLENDGKEETQYVSSYKCPTPSMQVGQVQYLQFTGFFTRRKIEQIYGILKDFAMTNESTLPWCSIDVQGFADSPVSWGLKEHNFYTDGDNSYTVVLRPSTDGYILRRSLSSNNKPKITQ